MQNNARLHNIISKMQSFYPMSKEAMELLYNHLKPHIFPKKHLIIRGGMMDRKIYFIEKGITRSYCLVKGKGLTTSFSCEGDIAFA